MRTAIGCIVGLALVAGLTQPAGAIWNEPRDPDAVRATYEAISARLEPGGDLMIIANTEGVVEKLVETGIRFAQMFAEGDVDGEVVATIRKVGEFLQQNGFYAVEGLGFSSVPRADQLHSVSMFVKRDADAAAQPLWRAMVGGGPSEMGVLDYLPRDTALARAGTADIRFLWRMVQTGISELGGEEAEAAFQGWQAMAAAMLGTPVDALVNSIAPESVLAVQLSREETVEFPADAGQTFTIPRPALLLVTAINSQAIVETLKQTLATQLQMPLPEAQDGDAVFYPLPLPVPTPIPVSITLATHGNTLLIGSTEAVVREAVAAFRAKDGLKAEAEFQAAFPALEANNGIFYASRRLGETLAGVQKQMLEMGDDDMAPGMGPLMRQWIDEQEPYFAAMTIMNYRSGVRMHGLSSSGGRELVAALTVAPLGVMAGMAMPAFVQARGTAQRNNCINNLRMLESGKEQWAMAERQADGVEPDAAGVMEYIRGGMVTCPDGGTYELNPIGTPPVCSVHGSLPGW